MTHMFNVALVLFKALVGGLLYFWALNVSVAVYSLGFWDFYMWSLFGMYFAGLYIGYNVRRK